MRSLSALIFLFLAAFSLPAQPQGAPTSAVVKEQSRIEFHSSSTFGKTVGVFHSWDADLKMPADNFADASLTLDIDSASVETGSGLKDKEAKGKNFFNVKEYPKIRFVSKNITADADPTKLHMDAELTMRGVTKPVSIAIILHPRENGLQRIEGDFSFDRRDFGMIHNVLFDKIANTVVVQFQLVVRTASPVAVPATSP
ncbi:MAG: YceI family protein [Candidatus Acidiferrales bacterium]|jgi:polyisoprenoid-binding protein YceI